jgi:hypothetical protein
MRSKTDNVLCAVYGILAAIALVATWFNNIAFLQTENSGGLAGFIQAGYANYASTSLTNDLLLAAAVAFVFMVAEARRVGIPHVWIYLVLSIVIAFSVALPLFLIARQIELARQRTSV